MLPLRDSIASSRTPFVNTSLIVVNILVFIYEFTLSDSGLERFVFSWAAVPASFSPAHESLGGIIAAVPTLFTSMFLHGGIAHVGGNMLFLWVFGDNVEDRFGHVRYLIVYIVCGLAAAITQILFSAGSAIPILGASGAIGGVMGAYLVSYPHARILTFVWFLLWVRFFWVPSLFYLGIWFAMQFFQGLGSIGMQGATERGGVAVWAHVGGFAAGALLALITKPLPPLSRIQARSSSWPYA